MMLYIKCYHKQEKRERTLTVDSFLAEAPTTLGDTTKHRQLQSLISLIDGCVPQNDKFAYYIPQACDWRPEERNE
jgi:hypothetical protein